jgi:hypothetical protein
MATPPPTGVFVIYKAHYHINPNPTENAPTTYSDIMICSENQELQALRYANERGLKVVWVPLGNLLDTAIAKPWTRPGEQT